MTPQPGRGDPVNRSRFAQLEALFDAIVGLEGDARAQALAEAARTHPHVHEDLTALLAAHDRLAAIGHSAGMEPVVLGSGSRVGAYRLCERLGEGGMGEIYRAERADGAFAAEVAVKVTRPGLASTDLLRRFATERQILASLNHPNVVRLLDGGAADTGQAYLVMEHLAGVPLTTYCRTHRLSLAARLDLFRAVCQGVQYAHQHGVVHRDLKPANVLVGDDGVPKVVDFGIARLLDDAGATGDATRPGGLAPLTPNYASPEQLRGLPVTTAADIYALGVMLYELVAGTRPYDTDALTLDHVLEIVMHVEPPRPSAVANDAVPYAGRVLKGDLDAIVAKAMRKEPAQRYASAAELAEDIGRWLRSEPLLARPPSAAYVLRRLAARHKAVVAVSIVAIGVIVAALGVALWQRQEARAAQTRAEARLRDVRQLANALIFKIHDAVTPLAGSTPVRRAIVEEAIGYLERVESESEGDTPLRLELAAAYRRLASILGDPASPNLGDRAGALALFERSRALVAPAAEAASDRDAVVALIDGQAAAARILSQQGENQRAIEIFKPAQALADRLAAAQPSDPQAASLAARASFSLAILLPPGEARPVWEETLNRYERLLAASPADAAMQRNVALVCKYLGGLHETAREFDTASRYYARAVELDSSRLTASPEDQGVRFDAAISLAAAATVADWLGDVEAAASLWNRSLALRRAIAGADPKNLQARHRLGYLQVRVARFHAVRRPREAKALLIEAMDNLQEVHAATGDRQSRYDLGWAWLVMAAVDGQLGDRRAVCDAYARARGYWNDPPDVLESAGQTRRLNEANAGVASCSDAQLNRKLKRR